MTAPAPVTSRRWLYGPLPDLLLGCGLWYAIALAIMANAGEDIRQLGGLSLMPFAVLFFGTPHYGATLLRVYEHREDRRAYTYFAVHATLIVAAAFIAGVYNTAVGSLILTIYITWSPWHYTGQNYGIAVMFLRRRGVPLEPLTKRFLYASFILSYLLTFLALHTSAEASHYAPVAIGRADTYRFRGIGLPPALANPVFAVLAISYVGALIGAAIRLLRSTRARDLGPVAGLVLTQALWFTVPLVLRRSGIETGIDPWESSHGTYYFLWIAVGHSVQYVWITSFYAKAFPGWSGQFRYLVKVMLAGAAVWTLPSLVFAPGLLGRVPYDAGLGILVASAVNIHHFILDGAIWKLRDGRVARILLRSREGPSADLKGAVGRRWMAPAVWVVGAVCFAIMFGTKWEREFGLRRASDSGALERALTAARRLSWVGRDSSKVRHRLGQAYARRGNADASLREYQRALEIAPSPAIWHSMGRLYSKQGQLERAAQAYEAALALGSADERIFYDLGLVRMELSQPERAAEAFERAAAANPERKINQTMLERAKSAARDAPARN